MNLTTSALLSKEESQFITVILSLPFVFFLAFIPAFGFAHLDLILSLEIIVIIVLATFVWGEIVYDKIVAVVA